MSVIKVVDVKINTDDTEVLEVVVDQSVVGHDSLVSHLLIHSLNHCTDLSVSSGVGSEQFANVAAESSCRAVVAASGIAIELQHGCLTCCLMAPQDVAGGEVSDELVTACAYCQHSIPLFGIRILY